MMNHSFPKLKVCGITTLEDARFAAGALADYLGFVFASESPRYIQPRDAAEISRWIEGPGKVGVFVNQHPDEVNAISERVGLDLVQLHGDESVTYAKEILAPVVKVFRIRAESDLQGIKKEMKLWNEIARFYLFDSKNDNMRGGTGESWDWSMINELSPEKPFFLAGGISHENVAEAVEATAPFGVDLSSSLEVSPGIKDFDKMQSFFDQWNKLRDNS
ncbi:MAG: phosphoribosylanthranilate isomerase [Balneolaceae bacterium]|nr:MAG: phosphoribosylanthranilate isomerase [Balneolaceae bacterium]